MSELLPKQIELGAYYKHKLEGAEFIEPTYPLWKIQKAILDWNLERGNIVYDAQKEYKLYASEAKEGNDAYDLLESTEDLTDEEIIELKCEIIDSICDRYVVMIGTIAKSGYDEAPLFGENLAQYKEAINYPTLIEEYGAEFDFYEAMEETLKEIGSRIQSPEQAESWDLAGGNILGEKWQKWAEQPADTLYKADYVKCFR